MIQWQTLKCSALNGMSLSHLYCHSSGIYVEEKKWKDLKSQRWLMAWINQHFPNKTEPRQTHIWTQWDCDNTHKFCRRTKLDNIPTWRGEMSTNYHPIKEMALQIDSCWKRKSQFSSKRGTLVKPALLKCRLQAQEKQHTWYHVFVCFFSFDGEVREIEEQ